MSGVPPPVRITVLSLVSSDLTDTDIMNYFFHKKFKDNNIRLTDGPECCSITTIILKKHPLNLHFQRAAKQLNLERAPLT